MLYTCSNPLLPFTVKLPVNVPLAARTLIEHLQHTGCCAKHLIIPWIPVYQVESVTTHFHIGTQTC